ncbi:MAG: cytochrome P450 [Anaerolineales bacterium]
MSLQLPPTPHSNNRELLKDPLTYFLGLTREFGDVVCYRPALEPAYLINHPEYVRHVLVDNNRNYTKGTYINKMFHAAVADGLLTAEGEKWHRQRQLMQPSFNKKHIAKLDNLITSQASRVFEHWQEAASKSQPIYLSQEISALTLAIASRALFGVDLGEEIGQVGRAVDLGVALLEKPNNPRFQTSIQILEEIVQRIITSRRHSVDRSGETEDLLGTMMQTRDEETGLGMDDVSLRNQVITLLLAGYETTASALTWTFYLLSQHPGTVIRLRQELQTALGGKTPTYADLPELELTRMVFEESLRMYPPAWVLGRVALGEDTIGNFIVPAGTVVAISPYTLHRHLGFWNDPEIFNPDRFTQERSNERHRFAFIPFGAGPRKCIGSSLAMVEAQLIIATAMQRFDLSLVSDHEIKPEIGFVARPDRQMKMMVSPQADG